MIIIDHKRQISRRLPVRLTVPFIFFSIQREKNHSIGTRSEKRSMRRDQVPLSHYGHVIAMQLFIFLHTHNECYFHYRRRNNFTCLLCCWQWTFRWYCAIFCSLGKLAFRTPARLFSLFIFIISAILFYLKNVNMCYTIDLSASTLLPENTEAILLGEIQICTSRYRSRDSFPLPVVSFELSPAECEPGWFSLSPDSCW